MPLLCSVHGVAADSADPRTAIIGKCTELLQSCLSANPYYYKAQYWMARVQLMLAPPNHAAAFQCLAKGVSFDDGCLVCEPTTAQQPHVSS